MEPYRFSVSFEDHMTGTEVDEMLESDLTKLIGLIESMRSR